MTAGGFGMDVPDTGCRGPSDERDRSSKEEDQTMQGKGRAFTGLSEAPTTGVGRFCSGWGRPSTAGGSAASGWGRE